MIEGLVCWKCGGTVDSLPQPLSRRAECPACHADLHVCRLCRHFDTGKAKQCREPVADEVKDKTRANFCEWFQPQPQAYASPATSAAEQARSDLNALFGEGPKQADTPNAARQALDNLFGGAKD